MTSQLLFIGTTELLIIAAIALLLFGGKKLPELMKGLGQGVASFKKGMSSSEEGDKSRNEVRGTKSEESSGNEEGVKS
jgi:sec-independent protein translocase protein TatA